MRNPQFYASGKRPILWRQNKRAAVTTNMLKISDSLLWRHNGRDGVSNHQHRDCLTKHIFKRRSQKISKLRVTGLCVGNSPVTGEFPVQMASNAENVSIWGRHHYIDDFTEDGHAYEQVQGKRQHGMPTHGLWCCGRNGTTNKVIMFQKAVWVTPQQKMIDRSDNQTVKPVI